MPIIRNRSILEVARNLRAFVEIEIGLTRGRVLDKPALTAQVSGLEHRLRLAHRRSQAQVRLLEKTRRRLDEAERELARLKAFPSASSGDPADGGIHPGSIVWVFGTARTGSTWLSSMMAELTGRNHWVEPYAGTLFGPTFYKLPWRLIGERKSALLSRRYKHVWLKSVRSLVLDGAGARFPGVGEGEYLIVKDPHGSPGAPVLMEALPESRIVLLVRDPRDVVASILDSSREDGWRDGWEQVDLQDPDALARVRAELYLDSVTRAKQAYDAHEGHKALVRYEDLRADPAGGLMRIFSDLGILVDGATVREVAESSSWERIPDKEKGGGKRRRKAKPGGWREDLTPGQAREVEKITAPLLEEYYPSPAT